MSILKSNVTQYTFNTNQIKELIAADLNMDVDKITVKFNVQNTADDRFGNSTNYELVDIQVIIKNDIK